jgi:hypothetical protein
VAGMGPPPKKPGTTRRRNATLPMTQLPAEGRKGRTPKWPLPGDQRATALIASLQQQHDELEERIQAGDFKPADIARLSRLALSLAVEIAVKDEASALELQLWRELWRTPQAHAWERLRWNREVAQYVRWKARAECGDLDSAKEARQLADRLGLNPLAMLRLRWEIAPDEVAEQRATRTDDPAATRQASARTRLQVVDPGAVAGS